LEIDESKLWYCEQKGYPDEYLEWGEKDDKDLEKERPEGTS